MFKHDHFFISFQDTIIKEILQPVIRVVSSPSHNFPSGSVMRTIICHKFVDAVYIIGLRIGFEMTRQHMTKLLQNFFVCFNPVNDMFKTEIPGSPQPIRTVLSNSMLVIFVVLFGVPLLNKDFLKLFKNH